ncbi:MAG: acyl-ACP--UDP-N-acetylglucosamine O-acyltransferase [Candidatus Omnitrophica bacterium]|jgi:UDP-N-acetylglucosamine acyltransferase|nr:acyl-ACP--UDP-N-acetylglucosamine O-acyltransferase [Candidatus Omnitrophota bacterium]
MIHSTAIVDKDVILGENTEIGPYSVVEPGVQLGRAVRIGPYVHLKGNTYIGDNTFIGSGSVIGEAPQILGKKESLGKVHIGKNNIIREYVTINSSSSLEKATVIGDDNYLMAFSHLAHDCKLANSIVICNGSLIAGHVEIHDKAFVSGSVVVHQFVRIGRLAMVGGLSRVNQDIPPFMMVVGDSRVWGINAVGIKRAGFKQSELAIIKDSYNYLYRKKLPLKNALAKIREIKSPFSEEIALFILSSQRGICGPKKSTLWEKLFLDYPYFLRTRIPFPYKY